MSEYIKITDTLYYLVDDCIDKKQPAKRGLFKIKNKNPLVMLVEKKKLPNGAMIETSTPNKIIVCRKSEVKHYVEERLKEVRMNEPITRR